MSEHCNDPWAATRHSFSRPGASAPIGEHITWQLEALDGSIARTRRHLARLNYQSKAVRMACVTPPGCWE